MFSDHGGYYKFPNGLIMQWGIVNIKDDEKVFDKDWNQWIAEFPIPFPNKCLNVTTTIILPNTVFGVASAYVKTGGLSQFSVKGFVDVSESGQRLNYNYGGKVAWLAIGY